jgi:HK97 family phage prohead protease
MEYKDFNIKFFSQGERRITGIASHTGNPADLDGDVIAEGAFQESIVAVRNGKKMKLLDGHAASGATTIGVVTKLWMDGNMLMFEAKISESGSGEDIYVKLKEGILDQVSIGFRTKNQSFRDDGIRVIEDLELVEISVVPIPANPQATIVSVKSQDLTKTTSEEDPKTSTDGEFPTELYKQHLKTKLNILNIRSNNNE